MTSWWSRGLWRLPRPSFVFGALAVAAASAGAQDPMRPWLDWRSVRTAHYRFHYPAELEQWTRHAAARVERVDSMLGAIVGYTPERAVHVVVHDPYGASNGYVLPMIERPTTVWWATPPDPRNDIGNFTTWGELLAVHELAHVAHLTRPSRNPLQRAIWNSLPTTLGPIARNAPRWVFEGYATFVEGRVTGSGRPHHAWRPALLRQWAIEGQLPTYGALNGSDAFNGGAFAYLGGSAFLEWLAAREGDSSLVHVWRRMTARRQRGFDAAFAGVYGDRPAALYGRHVAEVTRDAMAAKAALERADGGIVEGELLQRLSWETGDPAISPDGSKAAIVLRDRVAPPRVVVWSTAEEPEDTAAIRRRIDALKRDPHDVPDRRFFPRAKKALKTLPALDGRAFQHPRWFPDNRRLLLTRWTPRSDGSVSPDLWIWNSETDDLRKVTRGTGVLHGDVAPDGRSAAAMQCHWGHCDVSRVDLDRGVMRTLLEGNAEVSYYRPRYSPDGMRIAASVAENGRWRVVVADRDGRMMQTVDPDDGANRYDAEWLGPDTLVVVSEAGGIANLEAIDVASGATRTLTRVTGAAVAPAPNRSDRSIWFLSLHARGLDVRRLAAGARADSVVAVTDERFGFAGIRRATPVLLAPDSLEPSRRYGLGPHLQRWLPGGFVSGDGVGGFLTIFTGDIVGRLGATATAAYGEAGTVQGGSIRATWRRRRPAIEIGSHVFLHEPSLGARPQVSDTLDMAVVQHVAAVSAFRAGDGWSAAGRVGGSAGSIASQVQGGSHFRGLGFGEASFTFLQGRGGRALLERVRLHATQGHTTAAWRRAVASFELETAGPELLALQLRGVFGRVVGTPHPWERFTVGGAAPPIGDSSAMSQRFAMPVFPTGVATGNVLIAWRVSLPSPGWTAYYEGASVSDSLYGARRWHRAAGLEMALDIPPIPVVFTPRVRARVGAAWTFDAPFRRRVRAYLSMQMEP